MVSEEFSQFGSVIGVFVNTELKVLAELFVELLEVFSIFADFLEELKTFLGDVLLDDFQDFVVLEILSADVKREIFRVDNTSDEAEIFGDEVFTIIHNEDSSDVELDVIFLLLGFEHIEGSSLGDKDNGSEFKSSFH